MKKKLLPIALLCALGLVGCAETPAPTESGTNTQTETSTPDINVTSLEITKKEELHEVWRLGDEDRTISVTAEPAIHLTNEINKGNVKITSSDSKVISVIGKKIHAAGEGYATITVQWKDGTIKDEIRLEVIPAKLTKGAMEIEKFNVGGTYKIGLYQKKLKKYYLINASETGFAVKEKYTEGAGVVVTAGTKDGSYNLKVGTKFLSVKETPNADKAGEFTYALELADTAYDWAFDEGYNTFAAEFTYGEGDAAKTTRLVVGTKGTATDITLVDLATLPADETASIAHLYDFIASATLVDEVKAGNFLIGSADGIYLTSKNSSHNIAASLNPADAATAEIAAATGEGNEGKWTIKVGTQYVTGIKDGSYYNLVYGDKPYAWEYSTRYNNFSTKLGDKTFKIGFKAKYTEFTLYAVNEKVPAAGILNPIEFADPIGVTFDVPVKEVTVGEKLELAPVAYPQGAKQVFKYTVDNAAAATIEGNTLLALGKGNVKVTAQAGDYKATVDLKINPLPIPNGLMPLKELEDGGVFKLGMMHTNPKYNKVFFLNGEKGEYLPTTEDYAKAVSAITIKETDGWSIKVGDKYLGLGTMEKEGKNGPYTKYVAAYTTEKFVWNYNTEYYTFETTVPNLSDNTRTLTYALGTKASGTYTTISTVKPSDYNDSCLLRVYDFARNPLPFEGAKPVNGTYFLKTDSGDKYLTDIYSSYNLAPASHYSNAGKVVVKALEGDKYSLMIGEKYVVATGGDHVNLKMVKASSVGDFAWSYNAQYGVFTCSLVKGTAAAEDYMMGYDWNMKMVKVADIAKEEPLKLYNDIPEADIPAAIGIVATLDKTTIEQQDTAQISTVAYPTGAVQNGFTYESNNTAVATVDNKGKVTGVAGGKATITAKLGSLTSSVEITVNALPEIDGIRMTSNNLGLTNSYKDYTATVDGVEIKAVHCADYGDGIQMRNKKSTQHSYIYNTAATTKKIASINFVFSKDAKNLNVYFGTAALAEVDANTKVAKLTVADGLEYTVTAPEGDWTFFRVDKPDNSSTYLKRIEIIYAK